MTFFFITVPQPPMRPPPVEDMQTTSTSAVISWFQPPGNITIIRYVVQVLIVGYRSFSLGEFPAKRQTETGSLQTCLSSRSDAPGSRTLTVNANSSVVSLTVTDLCELVEH